MMAIVGGLRPRVRACSSLKVFGNPEARGLGPADRPSPCPLPPSRRSPHRERDRHPGRRRRVVGRGCPGARRRRGHRGRRRRGDREDAAVEARRSPTRRRGRRRRRRAEARRGRGAAADVAAEAEARAERGRRRGGRDPVEEFRARAARPARRLVRRALLRRLREPGEDQPREPHHLPQHGGLHLPDRGAPPRRSPRSRTASASWSRRNKFPGYVLVRMDLTDESWSRGHATPPASPASSATPTSRRR